MKTIKFLAFSFFSMFMAMIVASCSQSPKQSSSESEKVSEEMVEEETHTSDAKLKQDGEFDDFYLSLAKCFDEENLDEINKIFLFNEKGKRVFNSTRFSEDTWDEDWGSMVDVIYKGFVSSIKNKDCVADEMNPALLIDLIEEFGLDEEEIHNHALLWYVIINDDKNDPSTDFLDGCFMKYKGKWYYIGDYQYYLNKAYE